MWQEVIHWLFDLFQKIGSFSSFLFTYVRDLPKEGIIIPGWSNFIGLFGNFRIVDLISVGGLTFVFVILIVKKLDFFA